MNTRNDALQRASRIKLMIFDVDGVLTDGSLYFNHEGEEFKVFNSLDGHGMRMLRESGVRLAIITGRKAPCVEWRMKNLRIDLLLQGVDNKLAALKGLLDELGLTPEEAGFMGDDVIDLEVMKLCGFSAAPVDAHDLVLRHARLIADKPGGRGAVRQICEFILHTQGKLDAEFSAYLSASGQ